MIIGINGPIGSGKNEVAKILEKNWGFKAVGFADKLKQSFAALFDIDPKELEIIKNDPEARVSLAWSNRIEDIEGIAEFRSEKSITGREALKRYGTECHRNVFWHDFWIDALFHDYLTDEGDIFDNLAIYDARFNNELEKIRELGGINIQVRRPGHEFDPTHPSETSPNLELIDYMVLNNETLKDLENVVNDLVRSERLVNPALLGDSNNLSPSPSLQPALDS